MKTLTEEFIKLLEVTGESDWYTSLSPCLSDLRPMWIEAGFVGYKGQALVNLLTLFNAVGLHPYSSKHANAAEHMESALVMISMAIAHVAAENQTEHPELRGYASWEAVKEVLDHYRENLENLEVVLGLH